MHERIENFFQYTDSSGLANVHAYSAYIKKPDKIKSLSEVQEYDKKAAAEIEYLKAKIELMSIYRAELFNRFQEINAANFHLRIRIDRQRRYYENKVFYYITIENIPDRADVAPLEVLSECYNGKERHTALKRFDELCKQYPHAETIKKIEKSQWE